MQERQQLSREAAAPNRQMLQQRRWQWLCERMQEQHQQRLQPPRQLQRRMQKLAAAQQRPLRPWPALAAQREARTQYCWRQRGAAAAGPQRGMEQAGPLALIQRAAVAPAIESQLR